MSLVGVAFLSLKQKGWKTGEWRLEISLSHEHADPDRPLASTQHHQSEAGMTTPNNISGAT